MELCLVRNISLFSTEIHDRIAVLELIHVIVSLGKSSSAALERLIKVTDVLLLGLAEDGHDAAFVNLNSDFMSCKH
jgi:Ran-binding protein 9/10